MKRSVKNIDFIILAVTIFILLIAISLHILQKEHRTILAFSRIIGLPGAILFLIILILEILRDRLYKRLYDVNVIRSVRVISRYTYYLCIFDFALLVTAAVTRIIYINEVGIKNVKNHNFIIILLCVFAGSYFWKNLRKAYLYFNSKDDSTIQATYYVNEHEKLWKEEKTQESYESLLKACETVPDSIELCCRMASFSEIVIQDSNKADDFISKAKSLIDNNKEISKKLLACYEFNIGVILLNRKNCDEGYQHIEKSIELDPTPKKMADYKELRSIQTQEL
jgi:hypothetical protein